MSISFVADYTFFDRAFGKATSTQSPCLSHPGRGAGGGSKKQIRTNKRLASRRVASVLQKIHLAKDTAKEQIVSEVEAAGNNREYIGLADRTSPLYCALEGNGSSQFCYPQSHELYYPGSGLLKPKELAEAHHSPKVRHPKSGETCNGLNGTAHPRYNSSQLQEILYGGPDAPTDNPRAPRYHFEDPGGSLASGDKMATTRHLSLLERKKKQWEEERGEFSVNQYEYSSTLSYVMYTWIRVFRNSFYYIYQHPLDVIEKKKYIS